MDISHHPFPSPSSLTDFNFENVMNTSLPPRCKSPTLCCTSLLSAKLKQTHYRPGQALRVPGCWGSQILKDDRHMKVVRLSAICTGCLYPPGNTPGTHVCQRLSQPQGHSAAGRIMSMKNCNDTIGNRTHNLLACSTVPQSTMPPHTPHSYSSSSYSLSTATKWRLCRTGAPFTHRLPSSPISWQAEARRVT
jgi:hypothetical protein